MIEYLAASLKEREQISPVEKTFGSIQNRKKTN